MNVQLELLQSVTPRRLHLILLPTEACNFRCVYCYETFRLRRMAPGVVTGVKRLIARRAPTLDRLVVSWFGGEPLLALDVMEDVMDHVAALRRAHPALVLASDATTNASLLTQPVLERLVARGVTDYQVTFDGPREFHDRKRVRPGGRPTFDRIWENLVACRGSTAPFRIQLRLHVDRENAGAVPEFLSEIQRVFGDDDRFEVFIRGLSRLGGPNDETLPILEGAMRSTMIQDLRALAAARGIRQAAVPAEPGVCYAARGNSFVIRADGRVNKCTVALDHPTNQVGRIEENGDLRLRSEMIRPWMRGFGDGDRATLACPMHGLVEPVSEAQGARTPRPTLAPAAEGAA